MKAEKILLSGMAGTSLMTLFSYAVSNYKGKNFREPELLAALLKGIFPANQLPQPLGWGTHYSMGVSWATVFHFLFENTSIKPSFKNGLLLGGVSGVTAIAIWRLTFKLHPNPPRIECKSFYGHLFIAHLVYSMTVTMTATDIE